MFANAIDLIRVSRANRLNTDSKSAHSTNTNANAHTHMRGAGMRVNDDPEKELYKILTFGEPVSKRIH